MKTISALLPLMVFLLAGFVSSAQDNSKSTIFDQLQQEELPHVTLEIDLDSIMANRKNEDRVGGIFHFPVTGGEQEAVAVAVNVRGRFRRMRCDFPPLKLNFVKSDLKRLNLDKFNNLKLVTHCLNDWQGEDALIREFLVYQMYARVTSVSYRTQLVKITYRNTGQGRSFTAYGFLLEDEDELAERLASELCEDCYEVPVEHYNTEATAVLGLFQYLIGNADWVPKILRNLELLKPDDGSPYQLVPYDFDFSGVVDPPYAIPAKVLGIRTVRERLYLGFPYSAQVLDAAWQQLSEKKQEMLACLEIYGKFLNNTSRRDVKKYLEEGFNKLEKMAPEFEAFLNDRK